MSERDINVSQSSVILFNNWDRRDGRTVDEARGSRVHQNVAFDLVNTTVTNRGSNTTVVSTNDNGSLLEGLIVPLYATIFLLSVIGNCLVLVTLARNKRMRTVTNVYLLNLSCILRGPSLGFMLCCNPLSSQERAGDNGGYSVVTAAYRGPQYPRQLNSIMSATSGVVRACRLCCIGPAVSDLLLGVFCMPFTLLGQILKNFVFGLAMCKLIPYFQAVSVSVGVWTLVAISLERYFAICRPLKSRRWQTQFHAYKMIALVWAASLTWNTPILVVSRLRPLQGGRQKCREEWPTAGAERAYNLFLDGTLLLIPLVVMSLAYSLIATKLWRGLKREIRQSSTCKLRLERVGSSATVLNPYTNIDKESSPSGGTVVTKNGTISKQSNCGVSSSTCLQVPPGVASTIPSSGPLASKGRKHRKNSSRPGTEFVKLWLTKRSVCPPRSGASKVSTSKKSLTFSGSNMLTNARLQTGIKKSRGAGVDVGSSQSCDLKDIPGDDHSGDANYAFGRQHAIRSNYMGKSIEAKKKVIRMLFVVVLEFFVCWAPLYVVNTWYLFAPEFIYHHLGRTGISLVQLLAYVSSCCNPITYCFMNRKFRQSFLSLFDCYRCWRLKCMDEDPSVGVTRNVTQPGNSELSGNESTIYLGRTSVVARSEVVRLLEEEDRV